MLKGKQNTWKMVSKIKLEKMNHAKFLGEKDTRVDVSTNSHEDRRKLLCGTALLAQKI